MPLSAVATQVFANAAGTVLSHPAGFALLRYQEGKWDKPELADLLTRLGRVLLQHDWHHCLADARQLPALSEASKVWLEAYWLGNSPLRPKPLHMALVQPADVFARLSVAQMQVHNVGTTSYTYFADEASATEWLLGQLASGRR